MSVSKTWKCSGKIECLIFGFVAIGTHVAVSDAVQLQPCEVIDVEDIESPLEYPVIASNLETLSNLEELVQMWCKQVEQVICKSYYHHSIFQAFTLTPL